MNDLRVTTAGPAQAWDVGYDDTRCEAVTHLDDGGIFMMQAQRDGKIRVRLMKGNQDTDTYSLSFNGAWKLNAGPTIPAGKELVQLIETSKSMAIGPWSISLKGAAKAMKAWKACTGAL
jgi:hypothetical protein